MDLKEYKKKLRNLSEEEQKLRDLYLRDMAVGKIQGPPTKYPSLNKRNLAFYDEKNPTFEPHPDNVTKCLEENNRARLGKIALEYGISKISFKNFINEKNSIVKSLVKNGIKEKKYIVACLPGIPESMYLTYALGHLNAVGIFMPPYLDIDSMISDINKDSCELLFILDKFLDNDQVYQKINKVIEETNIKKIVIVPALYSAFPKKISNILINKKRYNDKFIYWDDFINEGKNEILPPISEYKEDQPVIVVYSSGSTGKLKGIELSHDNLVLPPQTYKNLGINLSSNQKFYQSIPLWSSTGLVALGTSPLYYGCTVYQNPDLQPEKFLKNIGRHHINWAVGTRDIFNAGIDSVKNSKTFDILRRLGYYQYKQLSDIFIGGTLLTDKDKIRLSHEFYNLGSKVGAKSSYGTCENAAIVTLDNIPLPGVTILILDNDNHEMYYNEVGRIAIKSDFEMMGYYNRPDLDKDIYYYDEIGDRYLITGDIGYLTDDHKLVVLGRDSDVSIIKGKIIHNFILSNIILKHENVEDSEVFSKQNDDGISYLCNHLVLKNVPKGQEKDILMEIQQSIYTELNDIDFVPEYFKVRDFFPIAPSTKRDYNKLKNETDGYYYIPSNYLKNSKFKGPKK